MSLPVPNLDDRRFDDLVTEVQARLANHLPELTQLAPGDPIHNLVDVFAWLTESILYRANLVPERQRRIFLNLLQVPLRPARPAQGMVCLDAGPRSTRLPGLVDAGTQLKAGNQSFTTIGELQPTPVQLSVAIKQAVPAESLADLGLSLEELHEQLGLAVDETPEPFQPRVFEPGREVLSLADSRDGFYYLALRPPRQMRQTVMALRANLAGVTLNIGLAPADEIDGDSISEMRPRPLVWELMSEGEDGEVIQLPLEPVADSSMGGRRPGVVRLRLPRNPALFKSFRSDDPMFAGVRGTPPELPGQPVGEETALWLRLHSPDDPQLGFGYIAVNAVQIIGQGIKRDAMVGTGNGLPDQIFRLQDGDIDPDSIRLDVEEDGVWVPWRRVDLLAAQGDTRVYSLDARSGTVFFGDGLNGGRRPPEGRRIRIASYRHGGGSGGNLGPGEIKEVEGHARLELRHEWPCRGGIDGETVEQAERRIPQFLAARNRAVTRQDIIQLSLDNPLNAVARAEVFEGFLPGASIRAARENVPGVVSVFVLPPGAPALGHLPRPSRGLLKDVFEYLLQRICIGTELYVLSPEFVPIALGLRIDVRDPETEQQTLREVREAMIRYLWPIAPGGAADTGWPMGGRVRANELLAEASRVAGVRAVNALSLFRRGDGGWRRLPENEAVDLLSYQLPELVGIRVDAGGGAAGFPGGIGPSADGGAGGGAAGPGARGVPAPVIPDVC